MRQTYVSVDQDLEMTAYSQLVSQDQCESVQMRSPNDVSYQLNCQTLDFPYTVGISITAPVAA